MTETLVQPESNTMPMEVRRAVGLLWLCVPIGLIAAIVDHWNRPSPKGVAFAVFFHIFVAGLWALLIWKIGQGRRWARITWLVLFACGALSNVFLALAALGGSKGAANDFNSPFSAVIVMVRIAISFYATVLLFSRTGGTWFLRKNVP
jgi:hypothetical protein